MDYNNKKFRVIENDESGELDEETVFLYQQKGQILTCTYSSKQVVCGHLLGLVSENGVIDMRYHQINSQGEIKAGECRSVPSILPNGKILLHEEWRWTSPVIKKGSSKLMEL